MLDDLQPGDPRLIGPYRLRGVLGAGAMGRVYLGASADERLVAVKVIHAGLAADPAFLARFRREIAVARKVSGPFTAPLVDADVDGPVPWLATAYVAGPSLADLVAEGGPMPPGAALELAARLAEGLTAIHAAGVVHRDLKPSNILLARDGPRLIDFGISSASEATALTSTDLVIGSPGYMSPEQAEGCSVGPPSDIFSLGAVLAFAVTGEGPFGSGSTAALIYRVIHRPADLTRVPGELRGLIERCLVKDPALRPAAGDLLAATRTARQVMEAVTAPIPVPAGQMLMPPDLPGMTAAEPWFLESVLDQPAQRERRPPRRPNWRPLAVVTIIAALAGAAAIAGPALVGAHHRAPAVQPERPAAAVRTLSVPTSSGARASRSAAAVRKTSSAAPSSPAPTSSAAPAGPTRLAGTTSPATADMPVVSSSRPSGNASPASLPSPSATAPPSPSASPSPTSGGYGY